MARQCVSRSVTVAAAPETVFALLADPARHPEIDGSGTVRGRVGRSRQLALGSRFRMRMRLGLPYLITNEVVEFEPDRRIAWRHWGRHIWRWILEPADGATRVTEEFEWGTARTPRLLELARVPERNDAAIRHTLERLSNRFGSMPDG